ncbi:MAG: hypothetical protein GX660_22215 [Clostridiaceae bacterium]|nr:hypothetical protein [Clostridiaceae bacterium]
MVIEKVKSSFSSINKRYVMKNGTEILVRKACEDDIPGIARLFEAVRIMPFNLDAKLSSEHEDSFINRGGFFEILEEKDILRLLNNDEYVFLVSVIPGKDGKDEVNSCLYCSLNTDCFSNMKWSLDKRELSGSFICAFNTGRVCTAVEHAVVPVVQNRGAAYPVVYEMYSRLMEAGALFIMLQIYTVTGVFLNEKYQPLYLPNKRSIILNERLGASIAGSNDIPLKKIGEREIEIKSQVYIIELKEAVKRLFNNIESYRRV